MSNIPEFIFIVPYRDREAQLSIFLSHMPYLLEGLNYEVYFAHQKDRRFFNRGAMKDIGFIHAKEKYPDHYKDINFVFHDVDTFLSKKGMTDFKTTKGIVKHVLGFERTFGGIFVMKGSDFENMNGFFRHVLLNCNFLYLKCWLLFINSNLMNSCAYYLVSFKKFHCLFVLSNSKVLIIISACH